MLRKLCLTVAVVSTACAPSAAPIQPAGNQAAEEAAVLAVMDEYMHEIPANDLAAMDARQTPEGTTYRHLAREDGVGMSWPGRTSTGSRRSAPTSTPTASVNGRPPS